MKITSSLLIRIKTLTINHLREKGILKYPPTVEITLKDLYKNKGKLIKKCWYLIK